MKHPTGISLEYHLEEAVSLIAAPSFRHIERWKVTVRGDDSAAVGEARLIVLNLESGMTPADLADEATGDWVERTWTNERGEEPGESSVLVLDRLWIDPEWRGNGLGPIVAACAIMRLGRGCRLVACYPAPYEAAQRPDDRDRSVEALSRIWAKVGFTPWNDGVWMLDLQSDAARESLERLLPLATSTTKDNDETSVSH